MRVLAPGGSLVWWARCRTDRPPTRVRMTGLGDLRLFALKRDLFA